MLFSIITPNYNGGRFLETTLKSILEQKASELDIELIVIDGNSTDNSYEILEKYKKDISQLIIENDTGPANAINKGLRMATGDIIAWLNADDMYFPGALGRVQKVFQNHKGLALCFGKCPIIDPNNIEIRKPITHFKEFFFPFTSRFTIQCINYVSQPALFFAKKARENVGLLREDMVAAWDYDFILKLWSQGKAVAIPGGPISAFRWHDASISGQNFIIQFKEELDIAAADAGRFAPQTFIHSGVRWGIVGAYSLMAMFRNRTLR